MNPSPVKKEFRSDLSSVENGGLTAAVVQFPEMSFTARADSSEQVIKLAAILVVIWFYGEFS